MAEERDSYAWLALAARLWWATGDDDGASPWLMAHVNAKGGIIQNVPAQSANDQLAALLVLLFIWWWNCAKYRANPSVSAQIRAKYFQNNAPPFFPTDPAETRAVAAYPSFRPVFFQPHAQCQMNIPLTVFGKHGADSRAG